MVRKLTFKQELAFLKERLWPKNLTFFGKIKYNLKKIKDWILNIDIFNFVGVLVGFVLMFYMHWFKAMVLGVIGYILYLRIETTLVKIFKK